MDVVMYEGHRWVVRKLRDEDHVAIIRYTKDGGSFGYGNIPMSKLEPYLDENGEIVSFVRGSDLCTEE
jgi:hypothetical protein